MSAHSASPDSDRLQLVSVKSSSWHSKVAQSKLELTIMGLRVKKV